MLSPPSHLRIMVLLSVVLATVACTPKAELVVQLRTDLAVDVEFDEVVVVLDNDESVSLAAEAEEDYAGGTRIADFPALPHGTHDVDVRLRHRGLVVASRTVRTELTQNLAVTVLMARSCRGVQCPGDGDPEEATECLAGRCVDAGCTPETPEYCPAPACEADSDCAMPLCGAPRCLEGACFVDVSGATCGPSEVCAGADGCVEAASDPASLWARVFSGDGLTVEDLAIHYTGAALLTGRLAGTARFGPFEITANDGSYLVAVGADGTVQWARVYDSTGSLHLRAVTAYSSYINLVGGYTGMGLGGALPEAADLDVVTILLNDAGEMLDHRAFGGPGEQEALGADFYSTEHFMVTGRHTGPFEVGDVAISHSAGEDGFVLRAEKHLDGVYAGLSVTGPGDNRITGVATDAEGFPFITGTVSGMVDLGGEGIDGGARATLVGYLDLESLAPIWHREIVGTSGRSIAHSADGRVYVAGRVDGATDFGAGSVTPAMQDGFVAAYGVEDGAYALAVPFGGADADEAFDVAAVPGAGAMVVGATRGDLTAPDGAALTGRGEEDAFWCEVGADGAATRTYFSGGPDRDVATAVAADEGQIYAAGTVIGEADFGDGLRGGGALPAVFLVRYPRATEP